MSMCRECWEPTCNDAELCDWCSMTPAQRKRKMRMHLAVIALVLIAVVGLMAYPYLNGWVK